MPTEGGDFCGGIRTDSFAEGEGRQGLVVTPEDELVMVFAGDPPTISAQAPDFAVLVLKLNSASGSFGDGVGGG